jgi:hypothetical protein
MSLRNLLKNPTEYVIGGVSQIDFKQKSILYPDGPYDKRPLLGERVTFDITDENAKPTFRGAGRDHGTFGGLDAFIRGEHQ